MCKYLRVSIYGGYSVFRSVGAVGENDLLRIRLLKCRSYYTICIILIFKHYRTGKKRRRIITNRQIKKTTYRVKHGQYSGTAESQCCRQRVQLVIVFLRAVGRLYIHGGNSRRAGRILRRDLIKEKLKKKTPKHQLIENTYSCIFENGGLTRNIH